jgi:hypothetical protein
MTTKQIRDNIKDNRHHLDNLIKSTKNTINVIIKHNEPFAATYAVSNPTDDTIIYVGQTSDIVSRLKQHISGNSDFSKKIKITENEFKWYKIRYRRMSSERPRKLFESYVIGELKPKYNF